MSEPDKDTYSADDFAQLCHALAADFEFESVAAIRASRSATSSVMRHQQLGRGAAYQSAADTCRAAARPKA